ncbi:hypothetical protein BS47DRAFT_1399934 [Hydnum rufescens UP504]|uniref:Uncharacterized protein n=1 Tax=Hydnum rufescens UP504 TaxID=1448309 RepID=A0A9P6AHH1_9AGAM|nr:hypothetical protein BS47DRAFT_1399934 [Hydnum rufescens UP504]
MHSRYRDEGPLNSLTIQRVNFTASTTIITLQLIFLEASELRRGFVEVCKLSANLSSMSGALEQKRGPRGVFWVLNFSVGIEFGGVELQAHVEWVEKGVTKRGKVSIIPPED